MADNYVARQQSGWRVVYVAPDVCKTPMGSAVVPVPYPVTAELQDAVQVAGSVNANGHPLVVFSMSKVPKTLGDAAGRATGIKSGTVEANCYPKEHSFTVRAEKRPVIRHGDLFWMNGA
ncbi:DUF4150 domain-containing protein [Xanthomonas cerealis pv. cerealis]|uniref:DUF4150 domain-containing protein n=1 Tax=Xanthomonas cerealis pv. cerealis TaxID=152263 RepID=A0A514E925_9XANT|nr:DUF4150 domain-containing protein [Xanthomonas translucens]QDI02511.1 DUF4150 domain-containing protein [Xanthomonas translucens pv. cerealis]